LNESVDDYQDDQRFKGRDSAAMNKTVGSISPSRVFKTNARNELLETDKNLLPAHFKTLGSGIMKSKKL